MKKIKLALLILVFVLIHKILFAGSAAPFTRKFIQPDGSRFNANQKGDEWLNWHETEDGYTILKNTNNGWWYYAKSVDNNGINFSSYKVGKIEPSKINVKKRLRPMQKNILKKNKIFPRKNHSELKNYPYEQKLLVILVDFTDVKATYSADKFYSQIFSKNSKSVFDYYNKVSYGNFIVNPASESFEKNDGIIGWLHLKQNNPNIGGMLYDDELNKLVSSCFLAADPYVDFLSYDSDQDGEITPEELSVIIIVAGYETSYPGDDSPSIWAHRYSINPVTLDRVKIKDYALFGEKHAGHMATMGVIAHELGHLMLALPDLYDIDGSSGGVGIFDLMAIGSWGKSSTDRYVGETPVSMSAWTKQESGFINPKIIRYQKNITLKAVSEDKDVIKIITNNPQEYFLLENRFMEDYDEGLFYSFKNKEVGGIAVWHIDESQDDKDNMDENHKMVDLEEADGIQDLDQEYRHGEQKDLFYKENNVNFNNVTNPNSKLYSGDLSNIVISNVSNFGKTMTLDVTSPLTDINITQNNDFESTVATTPWTFYSNVSSNGIVKAENFFYSGNYGVHMGGLSYATDYIYQDILIPKDAADAYLLFRYKIKTNETVLIAKDKLSIEIRDTTNNLITKLGEISNNDKTENVWMKSSRYDLSQFIGEKIRVQLSAINSPTLTTDYNLDDIDLFVSKNTANILIDNNLYNFGRVFLHEIRSKKITVTNAGKEALEIKSLKLTGDNPTEIYMISDDLSGKTLQEMDSHTLEIGFTPTIKGKKSAEIIIDSNDPNKNITSIPIFGEGLDFKPIISSNKYVVYFGAIDYAKEGKSTVKITNIGKSDLEINRIVITGYDESYFRFSHNDKKNIVPGDTTVINVSFYPSSGDYYFTRLIINSNDIDDKQLSVFLYGKGVLSKRPVLSMGSSKKGTCLISVINSSNDYLKRFRDKYSKGFIINKFIDLYYNCSPIFLN